MNSVSCLVCGGGIRIATNVEFSIDPLDNMTDSLDSVRLSVMTCHSDYSGVVDFMIGLKAL